MSRFVFAAVLPLALASSGMAFAQTASPACGKTEALKSQSAQPSTTTMANTSSGAGIVGSGASSASIATGPVDKTGVMSPCVPATSGQGVTGAVPDSKPSAP